MPLQFTNPDVAALYECTHEHDCGLAGVYTGRLSNLTPKGAEQLIREKSPHIRIKEAVVDKPKRVKKEEPATPPSSDEGAE